MGWDGGLPQWSDLERVLSDRPAESDRTPVPAAPRRAGRPRPVGPTVPYAELHAHSSFSFLDGASDPEDLVAEAARLGIETMAVTDHDGLYGAVRFAEAAAEHRLATVFGAELSLPVGSGGVREPRSGQGAGPDPHAAHLLVLARGPEGYRRLSRAIAEAHLAGGQKGRPRFDLHRLAEQAGGHWQILTGCRKGHVRRALSAAADPAAGRAAADIALGELVELFGRDRVTVELTRTADPGDDERLAVLAALAVDHRLQTVATTGAHFAAPADRRLADAMAAVRARRDLDAAAGWLPPAGGRLYSGAEMAALFPRHRGAVAHAAELGRECAFRLDLIAPALPPFDVPDGHTEHSWLSELVRRGADRRYAGSPVAARAADQIAHELAVIDALGFAGYFLIVHDIVEFCRRESILCQGRGSAANSAVCFALGVTAVDAVTAGLLFERFLSPERDGPPDIDIDIESERREEVIQYVYSRYGRERAAQVANVITYRPRSAVRDAAKALGFPPGRQDDWSRRMRGVGLPAVGADAEQVAETAAQTGIPEPVLELAARFVGRPRHLGIHSGGMVVCDRPVADVVPVEWARMAGRTVLQWDKDDCAAVGLVKFDLLGLGMLSALRRAIDLMRVHRGIEVDLARIDLTDAAVYEMIARADTVGVFQVESRAQMATSPRLRPRTFFDLVVQVALIRPGPIQGGSVHPYIRRRNGAEPVTYLHPSMERALAKTLGIPLFQEQLMELAVDVAGFSAAEADRLRRAMGAKRSPEAMARLRARFYAGMADRHGITGEVADRIYEKLQAFANYGFPESHAQSFAALVFYSAWFKRHHPAVFCAALLGAQPMGFYSPQSLVADARRHGVTVHHADVQTSEVEATLAAGGTEVRLGLGAVRGLGAQAAGRIVDARERGGDFASMTDLTSRVRLTAAQAEALATAGALACFGLDRRAALWQAGAAAHERPDRLPGIGTQVPAPAALPGMSRLELVAADVWATGVSPDAHPVQFLRTRLETAGVVPAARLLEVADGARVSVAGAVTHRQRPRTAGGVTFLNLEDETGMINVVCTPGLWRRYQRLAHTATALVVRGRVRNAEGAVSLSADRLDALDLAGAVPSRDFR